MSAIMAIHSVEMIPQDVEARFRLQIFAVMTIQEANYQDRALAVDKVITIQNYMG